MELGYFSTAYNAALSLWRRVKQLRRSNTAPYESLPYDGDVTALEDEDVANERRSLQSGESLIIFGNIRGSLSLAHLFWTSLAYSMSISPGLLAD